MLYHHDYKKNRHCHKTCHLCRKCFSILCYNEIGLYLMNCVKNDNKLYILKYI